MKSVRIRSYSGPYFPPFGLNTERYAVFSPNAGKCGLEELRIWALFTQWCSSNFYSVIKHFFAWVCILMIYISDKTSPEKSDNSKITNADMKILQYIRLHIKNSITQIAHYNTFHFLWYVHFIYAKCLFTNIITK